jgi:hypothetical protein
MAHPPFLFRGMNNSRTFNGLFSDKFGQNMYPWSYTDANTILGGLARRVHHLYKKKKYMQESCLLLLTQDISSLLPAFFSVVVTRISG